MSLFVYLYDAQPAVLRGGEPPLSLLLAPMGTHTMLRYLYSCVAPAGVSGVSIVTTFETSPGYEKALRAAGAPVQSIVSTAELPSVIDGHEPSDWLLLVDPRAFPLDGLDIAPLVREHNCRHAKHLVALETSGEGTREFVQLDASGNVRRIQRYYDGFTRLQSSGVTCSLVTAASGRVVSERGFESLASLRCELAAQGVPCRDQPFSGGTLDLMDERDLLVSCERFVLSATSESPAAGYRLLGPGIHVAESARVDPAARLLGPILIQSDAAVGPQATLIGPTVVGAGARIERGATVAQCAIMPGCVVAPGACVRQTLVARDEPTGRNGAPRRNGAFHVQPLARPSAAREVKSRRRESPYPLIKRGLDAIVALLGLITLSPILLVAALLVRITSRGPVLFAHEREGVGGRAFHCYKFRTMVHGAHWQQRALYSANQVDGPQFKLTHDPRVTWIGRILRSSNIDELPQLLNVLMGQMSLIGPRPSPFRENQICVPWRQARLSVRPGITGLWQICRHERSAGDFHQWIYYDMLYVRHMSLALDLKILVATLFTFGGRWAVPLHWLIPSRTLSTETDDPAAFTSQPETYHPETESIRRTVRAAAEQA
ncbi:MAG: sugar transferase [Phycisphaerae bacterium]